MKEETEEQKDMIERLRGARGLITTLAREGRGPTYQIPMSDSDEYFFLHEVITDAIDLITRLDEEIRG